MTLILLCVVVWCFLPKLPPLEVIARLRARHRQAEGCSSLALLVSFGPSRRITGNHRFINVMFVNVHLVVGTAWSSISEMCMIKCHILAPSVEKSLVVLVHYIITWNIIITAPKCTGISFLWTVHFLILAWLCVVVHCSRLLIKAELCPVRMSTNMNTGWILRVATATCITLVLPNRSLLLISLATTIALIAKESSANTVI